MRFPPRLQGVTATRSHKPSISTTTIATSSSSICANITRSSTCPNPTGHHVNAIHSHDENPKVRITCHCTSHHNDRHRHYYQGRTKLIIPLSHGMTLNKIGSYSLLSTSGTGISVSGRNLNTCLMVKRGGKNSSSSAGGGGGGGTMTFTTHVTAATDNAITNINATDNSDSKANVDSIKIQTKPVVDMGIQNHNNDVGRNNDDGDHDYDGDGDDNHAPNNRLLWLQEQMQHEKQQQQQSLAEINQQTKHILSLPIGSFTSNTMEQCLRLMEYYTRYTSTHDSLTHVSGGGGSSSSSTVQDTMYHNANQMTHILKRIIEENLNGNSSCVYFHPAMAETVCLYWRQVSPMHCPVKTLDILQHVRSIVQDEDIPYNNIISILAKCRNRHAALAVEGILWKMIELQQQPQHMNHNHADIVTYNSAISSWMHIAKSEKDAGQRAVAILNRLRDDTTTIFVKPNILSFSMALTALLRAEGCRAALQAEDLLQEFLSFYRHENGDWTTSSSSPVENFRDGSALQQQEHIQRMFDNVLEALCQRAEVDPEAAERAVRMLRYMESATHDLFGEMVIVDCNTYNMVLCALAKQPSTSSISTMQDIMSDMNHSYESCRNDKAIVNTQTYNTLIKAHVKNGDNKSAQATLYKMLQLYDRGNDHVRPDSLSWNLVIEAHAESAHEKAAHNISIILDKMHDFGKKHPDVQPDKVTMSSVLKILVRKASNGKKHAGKQAVQILDRMIEAHQKGNRLMKPDRVIFSSVINCIAKCGGKDAGSVAIRILNRMQNMYKDGDLDLRPDTVTINTTLSALANTETREAARRSEHLLEAMITGNDPIMAPNVKSYTLVISAWAKSGAKESVEKIEKLLLDMEKVDDEAKPNTVTYSTVLNAFAKSADPSSYDRAMRVLQRMESGAIDVIPNSYCYASVMECISKSSDKESICLKTITLLQRLIQQNKKLGVCRDSYTVVFNTAIKAIERSSQEKKDQVAIQILTLMKEANEKGVIIATPNVRTYNSVIRACAFTKGSNSDKEAAFETAMNALRDIRSSKDLSPDLFTYPAIFRAGEELLTFTDVNLERFRVLFQMACEDGLVDALLLKNMVNFLPNTFLHSLLGTEKEPSEVRLNDLPSAWRRNIYKGQSLGRKSRRSNHVDER